MRSNIKPNTHSLQSYLPRIPKFLASQSGKYMVLYTCTTNPKTQSKWELLWCVLPERKWKSKEQGQWEDFPSIEKHIFHLTLVWLLEYLWKLPCTNSIGGRFAQNKNEVNLLKWLSLIWSYNYIAVSVHVSKWVGKLWNEQDETFLLILSTLPCEH